MSVNPLSQLPKELQALLEKTNEIINNPVAAPTQLVVNFISTGDDWMYIRDGKVTPKDIYVFSPTAFTLLEEDGITPLDDGGGGNIVVDEVWDANSDPVTGAGSGPISWSCTFSASAEDAAGAIVLVDENGDVAAVYNGSGPNWFTPKNGYAITQQPDVVSGGGSVASFGTVTPLQFNHLSQEPTTLDADYVGSGDSKIDGDSGNKFNESPIFLKLDASIAGSTTGTSVVVFGVETTFGELPVDYLLNFIRSVSAADATVQDVIADMKGVASANWDQLSGAVPFTPLDQVKVELDEVRDAYDDEHNLPGGTHLTINQLFNGVIHNLGDKVDGGGTAVLARTWVASDAAVTGWRLGWNVAVDAGPAIAATAPDFVAIGSMARISTDAGGEGSAGYMEVYLNTDEDDNDGDFSIRFYVFTPDVPVASGEGYMKVLELKSSAVNAYPQVLIQTTRDLITEAFNNSSATETDKQIAVSAHNLSRFNEAYYTRKEARPDYVPQTTYAPDEQTMRNRLKFSNNDGDLPPSTIFIELDYGSIYLASGFLKLSNNTVALEQWDGGEFNVTLTGPTYSASVKGFYTDFGTGSSYGIDLNVGVSLAPVVFNVIENRNFRIVGAAPWTGIAGSFIREPGLNKDYLVWNPTSGQWERNGSALTDIVEDIGLGRWLGDTEQFYDPTPGLPTASSIGEQYIATATANGWTTDYLYRWNGSSWTEVVPSAWDRTLNLATGKTVAYTGSAWREITTGASAPFVGRDHTDIPSGAHGTTIGGNNSSGYICDVLEYETGSPLAGTTRGIIPGTLKLYYDDGVNPVVLIATDDGASEMQGENGWVVNIGSDVNYTAVDQDGAGYLFNNLIFGTIPAPYSAPGALQLSIQVVADKDRIYFGEATFDDDLVLTGFANWNPQVYMSYSTNGDNPAGALVGVRTPLESDPPHYGATKQYVDQLAERVIPWKKANGTPYTDGDPFVITEDDYFLDLGGDNNHIRYTYPGASGPLLDPLNFFDTGDLVNKAFVEAKFLEAEIANFEKELGDRNIYGYRIPRSIVPRDPAYRQDNGRAASHDEDYKVVSIDIVIHQLYGTWRDDTGVGAGSTGNIDYQPTWGGRDSTGTGAGTTFYFYNRKVGARFAQAVQPFNNELTRAVRDNGYAGGPYGRLGGTPRYNAANQAGLRWHSLLLHEIVGCVGDAGWQNTGVYNGGLRSFGRPTLRPPDDVFYLYPYRAEFYWGSQFEVSGQCTGDNTVGFNFTTSDDIVPGSIRLYAGGLPPAASPITRDDGLGGFVGVGTQDGQTPPTGTAAYTGGSAGISNVKYSTTSPASLYYVYGRTAPIGQNYYLPQIKNRQKRFTAVTGGYRPLDAQGEITDPGGKPDPGLNANRQSINPSLLMRVFFMDEVMFHIELPKENAAEMVSEFTSHVSHRKAFMLAMAQPPMLDALTPGPGGADRWMLCRIAFALKQTNQLYRPEQSARADLGSGHVSSLSLTPNPGLGTLVGAPYRRAPALVDPIDYQQIRTGRYHHAVYSPFPVSEAEYGAGEQFTNFSVNFDGQAITGSRHPILLGTEAWYPGYRYSTYPTTASGSDIDLNGHYNYER